MEIITLEKWLKHFHKKNQPKSRTLAQFINSAKVRSASHDTPLQQYMVDKKIPKSDIELLFENIQNRDEYLTRFFTMSLRIQPDKVHIEEKPMSAKSMDNNEHPLYKNLIRNIHYKGILKETKSGLESVPTYLDMLENLYLHDIIDYKILTPSARFYMKEGRLGSIFSSFFFRASIMNPYLVYSLNKSVLKGTRIFTPTLGWSSYCYGFLECPEVKEYVGTDVIPDVCEKTQELGMAMRKDVLTKIYCKPSEDLAKNKFFMTKYREHFDVVFFSPPYYKLEMYAGTEQSTTRYKTYEEWLEKYWHTTIQLCWHVLQKGGRMCYILSGYGSENTKEQYDLLDDMNKITKQYFKMKSKQLMHNKDVHVTKHKETAEQIMVFTK
uniref:DNA methylase N-4/N-6 domain-containing protein n=1 Tax=viral metagenome TaxID=1070528 RepID=A0A6C0D463_9ZZZZ